MVVREGMVGRALCGKCELPGFNLRPSTSCVGMTVGWTWRRKGPRGKFGDKPMERKQQGARAALGPH